MTRDKYFIVLEETTGKGYIPERAVFKSSKKVWKEELQRGTIFPAILEEQPSLPSDDPQKKTFVVADRRADRKEVHFDCDHSAHSLTKLSDGEAERLLKIASPEKLYQSFCKSRQSSEEQNQTERKVNLFGSQIISTVSGL